MSSTLTSARFATDFGELNVIADDGVVVAAGFLPLAEVITHLPSAEARAGIEAGELPGIADAVAAWEDGDADAITRVPVRLAGSPFFTEVWETLRTVPGGEVVSYAELAGMAGRPRAMRAAGTACARNAVGLFVPCHRVIAARGRLGSYGFGGSGIKAAMLAHEGVAIARGPVTEETLVGADARAAAARTAPRVRVERPDGEW
ncbi:methylated-DNA--[protein]-cysteine S-methyltransferase [Demequina sp. NBRC 110056]|uniref:methylated-DNA--[protein]-cysteine S-methyltransferase n=1 Tax=Demequina sp. NBRC 110056 TaxID=1570345 RepID=UPI0009FE2BB2|nr:methylated-DNA--[protein]-cysteine S-methyltransferase [Demequina sp. NBRC 110056]